MVLPMNWAKEFADLNCSAKEMADRLTMTGSKVECYENAAYAVENVVIGRIESIVPHPDSDHMVVCQVEVGQDAPLQIVTGAANLKVGDLVPVALDGSKLPGGVEIKKGVLRGVESCGMLCSLAELGLTTHDFPYAIENGILVLDEPVDGLDPVMRRQVWSLLMGDVADHGTTVLVSSHNLRELEDVCDHVGILSRGKVLIERSLSALQENVVKMQVVFQEKELPQLPGDLQVLHVSQVGRIHTLIIRGNATEITNRLAAFAPILMEALPLTLEEIFIYELGGEDYAVRDIVL